MQGLDCVLFPSCCAMSFVRSQSSTSITTQTSTGDDSVLFDDATSTEDDGRDYDPWSTPWSILDKNEDEKVNEFLNHMIPVPTMNSFNDPKELIAFVKIKYVCIHIASLLLCGH